MLVCVPWLDQDQDQPDRQTATASSQTASRENMQSGQLKIKIYKIEVGGSPQKKKIKKPKNWILNIIDKIVGGLNFFSNAAPQVGI